MWPVLVCALAALHVRPRDPLLVSAEHPSRHVSVPFNCSHGGLPLSDLMKECPSDGDPPLSRFVFDGRRVIRCARSTRGNIVLRRTPLTHAR